MGGMAQEHGSWALLHHGLRQQQAHWKGDCGLHIKWLGGPVLQVTYQSLYRMQIYRCHLDALFPHLTDPAGITCSCLLPDVSFAIEQRNGLHPLHVTTQIFWRSLSIRSCICMTSVSQSFEVPRVDGVPECG